MNPNYSPGPSPAGIVSETLHSTGIRPEIEITHGALSFLGEQLGALDKEIQELETALDPVSVRSRAAAPPQSSPPSPGNNVLPGQLPVPAERCTVSNMVVDVRIRIDDFATKVEGLRSWLGTLRQELRI